MIKDLEYRIDAMALKQNDVKLELTSKLAKAMHESDAIKTEKRKVETLLTQELERERKQATENATVRHTLTIRCSEMAVEVSDLQAGRQDSLQRAEQCEDALDDAEQRISQLSMQLSECYSKDQVHIRDISRLKGRSVGLAWKSWWMGNEIGRRIPNLMSRKAGSHNSPGSCPIQASWRE